MAKLRLSLLGSLSLHSDDRPIYNITSPKIQALLAYLAFDPERFHRREELVELLWPERRSGVGAQNLRQSLSRLSKALSHQPGEPPYLLVTRQQVQFNPESDHWLDIAEFTKALELNQQHSHERVARCRRCCRRLETIIPLYRGDFLQDVVADSPPFDEWVLMQREYLRREALQALHDLAEHFLWLGDPERAYRYAWHQVELDAWRESAYRQVMSALVGLGRRDQAIQLFERLRQVLEADLGLEPERESYDLVEIIRAGTFHNEAHSRGLRVTNLPAQHTPFIGRVDELIQVAERLDDQHCHLLTLAGPGGVGKSRLAIQAGLEIAGEYRDGVVFVPLASVPEPDLVLNALIQALQVPLPASKTTEAGRKSSVLNYLQSRELLLILDNFEHLLPAAGLLADIVAQAPQIKLLVTSRQSLGMHAEWILDIDGLDYPKEQEEANAERFSAVQLFHRCATRRRASFKLSQDTLPNVARICRSVRGSPLAIELASAWVRHFPLEEIAQAITTDLDFLAVNAPDLPERHRSTRASFEYSWKMLDEMEKRLLQAVSVFRGGFTLQALQQVCGGVQEQVDILLDKFLIRRVATIDGESHFDLHELIRQYAADRLEGYPDELQSLRDRHCRYYTAFLESQREAVTTPGSSLASARIEIEIDNVRQAWGWAITRRLIDPLDISLATIADFFQRRGWFQEGERLLERAAQMLLALGAELDPARAEATGSVEISILLGRLCSRQGAFANFLALEADKGVRLLVQSLVIFRYFDVKVELADVLLAMALKSRQDGIFLQSQEQIEESLSIARDIGDHRREAHALAELAFLYYLQNTDLPGWEHGHEALRIYKHLGDAAGEARVLSTLGLIATDLDEFEQAREYLQQSLSTVRRLGDTFRAAGLLNNLGLLAYKSGDYHQADQYFLECETTLREMGEPYGVALALYNRGRAAYQSGDYQKAKQFHQESLAIRQEMGNPYLYGVSEFYLGRTCLALGEEKLAEMHFHNALASIRNSDNTYLRLQILNSLAGLLVNKGETALALTIGFFALEHPENERNIGDFPLKPEAESLVEQLINVLPAEVFQRAHLDAGQMTIEDIEALACP